MDDLVEIVVQWLIPCVLSALLGWFVSQLHKSNAAQKARDAMLIAIGKGQLTDLHQRYVVSGVGCPVWVKDEAEDVYRAYHALGGNGVGTHLYEEIREAPIHPPQPTAIDPERLAQRSVRTIGGAAYGQVPPQAPRA